MQNFEKIKIESREADKLECVICRKKNLTGDEREEVLGPRGNGKREFLQVYCKKPCYQIALNL